MAAGELAAVFRALARDAVETADNVTRSIARLTTETAQITERNAARLLRADAAAAERLTAAGRGDAAAPTGAGTDTAGSTPGASPVSAADKLRKQRPKIRKTSQFQIFRNAERTPNGEDFVCPNSRNVIPCWRDANGDAVRFDERGRPDPNGFTIPAPNPVSGTGDANFHFGHVPESEYRRLVRIVEDHPGDFSRKEILDAYNDPSHYQVEHPTTNMRHGSESTVPGYGHYASMLNNGPQPPP